MNQVIAILNIISTLLPNIIALGTNAVQAFQTNDQVTLDALHAQALAMADALKPTGVS